MCLKAQLFTSGKSQLVLEISSTADDLIKDLQFTHTRWNEAKPSISLHTSYWLTLLTSIAKHVDPEEGEVAPAVQSQPKYTFWKTNVSKFKEHPALCTSLSPFGKRNRWAPPTGGGDWYWCCRFYAWGAEQRRLCELLQDNLGIILPGLVIRRERGGLDPVERELAAMHLGGDKEE